MKKIETHPSPEKLLRQVTEEAVNALALGGLRILDGQEQAHIFRPACSLMS